MATELLYHKENPDVDRSAGIIRGLLGSSASVGILSIDDDDPQNGHPLRTQARKAMKDLRPTETTSAAQTLLQGIGKSTNEQQVKAAQFLFVSLDFMKMEPNKLKEMLTDSVTEDTPIENIRAVIATARKTEASVRHYNLGGAIKGAVKIAAKIIERDFYYSSQYREARQFTSGVKTPARKVIDITELSEKDRRLVDAHHQGLSAKKIAEIEGTSPRYITNRLSSLRMSGLPVERKTPGGFEAEMERRRELVRDYTMQGMGIDQIIGTLKAQDIEASYYQVQGDRAALRNMGELPPAHRESRKVYPQL